MPVPEICDHCIYYHAYGLTHGTCMIWLLSKKSMKDMEVVYTDSCEMWTKNDNREKHKNLLLSYEQLKKEYALKKLRLDKNE